MHKTKRQQKILSLIRARRIGTQQELSAMLERAGFVAAQSSVSRDLEELGVVKHNGHYTLPRATDGAAARGLLGLEPAGEGELRRHEVLPLAPLACPCATLIGRP